MTNWQFITIIGTFVLSFFGFILTILGTARSTQTALNEQFTAFRNEMKAELETLGNEIRQNDKRYEERFARLEADIREIKNDLRQVFKPILPA
jgi:predicted PurR-regulated permease PerM